jgi:long-chain fatty acid transport protein
VFDGHLTTSVTGLFKRQDATFDAKFPQTIIAGWSYRPTPNWNLEFNLDWADWDVVNEFTLATAAGALKTPFNWKSSFIYKFDATPQMQGWNLSAGYWFAEETVPDAYFKPIVPDQALHVWSAGGRWMLNKWEMALTYQFGYGPTRNVLGSEGRMADGAYRWLSHAMTFSAGRRF